MSSEAKSVLTKSALLRARHTVNLRPERGQRTYKSTARIADGTACHVVEGDDEFQIDVPKSVGGEDTGPSPSVVLRAAISSCVAIGIKQWAALHDLHIQSVDVVLETRVDARGQLGVSDHAAPGFEASDLSIELVTQHAPDEVADMVAEALRYSPLVDVLKNPQTIKVGVNVDAPEP